VLHAEGGGGKPDYQLAARWFRQAADHGVNDSQYNLGILYARGIGVETNMAEAYKWFALASRNGDQEATRKRDDVASRLDRQSLASAIQAAQNWKPLPQPEAAVQVRTPAGGWDGLAEPAPAKRRVGPKG
jgi:localization factor PodJL